jgi:LysR family transcriptional regulator, low CO2-responsive transcriptional regulator
MNFTQLKAFDMVAREGSFSRAAEQLGLTQPALTIQVKALEEAYGVRLFDRARRRVALTEDGRGLFDVTRRLFALEEEAQEMLAASHELRRGHLRVSADGPHIVMGMFARFRRRYPNVRLLVTLGNSASVRKALLEQRVDIGILPGVENDPTFVSLPLWQHTPVLIVPWSHPWAERSSVTVDELHGQPMLMREEGSNTQKVLDAALKRTGAQPRVVLELGSREAVLGAVAAGLGFGMVWKVEVTGDRRFHAIDIEDEEVRSVDYVSCLRGELSRGVVRAMMSIAEEIHESGAVMEAMSID